MPESLEASLVRIRTTDGRVVGAGFLVGERYILTCTHVVSQALGIADSSLNPPQTAISLDFPRILPHMLLTASVVLWCPPLPDGSGDIAGLELEREPPSGAEVVRFAEASDVWKHDFSVLGFPTGYDDGVWATGRLLRRQATNWIQIEDVKAQGFAVAPGFSGTPVWDEQLQGVVGMVVAASRPTDTKTAFVIPLDVLATTWPLLTVPQGHHLLHLRRQAIEYQPSPLAEGFLEDLRVGNESVRENAAQALCTLQEQATVPAIISCLKTEPGPTIRYWLAYALGRIGAQAGSPYFKLASEVLQKAKAAEQHLFAKKGIDAGLEELKGNHD